MKRRQTRRSMSLNQSSFMRLQVYAKRNGFSCAQVVEAMVSDLVNGIFENDGCGYGMTKTLIENQMRVDQARKNLRREAGSILKPMSEIDRAMVDEKIATRRYLKL